MVCKRRSVLCLAALAWLTGMSVAEAKPVLTCGAATQAFGMHANDFAAPDARPRAEPGDAKPADDTVRDISTKIEESRSKLKEAERQSGPMSLDVAKARIALAANRRIAAQFLPALDDLAKAEAILKEIDPRGPEMAGLLRLRGITLSNMRRREDAIEALKAAIDLHAAGPAQDAFLMALNNQTLAAVYRGLGRYNDALAALDVAAAIYERRGDKSAFDLVEVLTDKSAILSRLNDKAGAKAMAERAVSVAEQRLGPTNRATARALHNLAIAERRSGAMAASFVSLGKVFAIYEGLDIPERAAEALEEASKSLALLNCFDDAISYQKQALARYSSQYGRTHVRVADAEVRLGMLARDANRNREAISHFAVAISIFDELLGPGNVRSAAVLRELSTSLSVLGRTQQAIAALLGSIRSLERETAPEQLRESLDSLTLVLRKSGNINAAILFGKKAVNTQQELRAANRGLPADLATAFAERYRSLYLTLADMLIEQGRIEEASRVIDLIKNQEMIDFVRGGRPKLTSFDLRAPLTRTESRTLDNIDGLLRQPFAGAKELEDLLAKSKKRKLDDAEQARLAQLKDAYQQSYKQFQTQVKEILDGLGTETAAAQSEIVQLHIDMLGQTQRRLKPFKGRAVILQIASLDSAVHIFLTGPKAQVHRSVNIARKSLARLAFDAWRAASSGAPDADSKLQKLYEVLVYPVEGDLKDSGASVVMLNLEGFLRYIPFAALRSGDRYLIEDYALAMQTPAADTVYEQLPRDRTSAVGFGVTDALQNFAGLPGVAREMETLFDGEDDAGVFAGMPRMNRAFSADEFALALEDHPQFVHIASHFKLEPGDESQSFLLLGTGDSLTLQSIRTDARFQFTDVDLLTLSACETAGEVGSDGKEVESFATIAQASGASSVMATLWPIADESTAQLMADFYSGLLDSDLDKATALQRAQIAMIHGGAAAAVAMNVSRGVQPDGEEADVRTLNRPPMSHPYHWSAFILMGNWL